MYARDVTFSLCILQIRSVRGSRWRSSGCSDGVSCRTRRAARVRRRQRAAPRPRRPGSCTCTCTTNSTLPLLPVRVLHRRRTLPPPPPQAAREACTPPRPPPSSTRCPRARKTRRCSPSNKSASSVNACSRNARTRSGRSTTRCSPVNSLVRAHRVKLVANKGAY